MGNCSRYHATVNVAPVHNVNSQASGGMGMKVKAVRGMKLLEMQASAANKS